MDLGLSDKGCVVLASSAGLGRAVATSLLNEGARVALSGRDPARLARATDELRAAHAERVFGEALDVTDGVALERHLRAARERFGSVHVLVTNSGGPPPAEATEIDEDGLRRAADLVLHPAVRAISTCLPWMRAQRWGRILAMTSLAVREPIGNLTYSNVARTGLTAYLKTLAGQVAADGVCVNSVCTGLFATERLEELFRARAGVSGRSPDEERRAAEASLPTRRLGRPEEFGDFVALLVSERASYLNGAAVPYDGGATRFLL